MVLEDDQTFYEPVRRQTPGNPYSFWKQIDLSLMLSDDPEAEAQLLS
jgi:hypothetical protein